MESLVHHMYVSGVSPLFREAAIPTLLKQARANNRLNNITGMLLYSAGSFFQVLEGESSHVTDTFAKIRCDVRHEQLVTITHMPIAKRSFAEWTMGFVTAQPQEIASLVGIIDLLYNPHVLMNLDESQAKKLLMAFVSGRWRTRLRNEQ